MRKKLWALFLRLRHTPFAWTLLALTILQAIFLLFACMGCLPKTWLSKGYEHLQTAVFLFLVYLLVSLNTLFFIIESSPIVAPLYKIKNLDTDRKNSIRKKYYCSVTFLGLSVLISGGLSAIVGVSILTRLFSINSWEEFLTINEVLCVFLFGSFVIADNLCKEACEVALKECSTLDSEAKQSLKEFIRTLKFYIYACDGPGLFGMVLILIGSFVLHPLVAGYYWHGFVAGAIGLHIAFSQTALALLSVMDVGQLHPEESPSATPVTNAPSTVPTPSN